MPHMEVTPVVKTIQEEMERRQWSVVKLGKESGVQFQTIYRIFAGASPNMDTISKLLVALELKLAVVR